MTDVDPERYAKSLGEALRKANLPKPEQLTAYSEKLPSIYRDILSAFAAGPERTEGDPVAAATIKAVLADKGPYTEPEIDAALGKLVEGRFLLEPEFMERFAPTAVGEALIATLTGKPARPVTVPELPAPTW